MLHRRRGPRPGAIMMMIGAGAVSEIGPRAALGGLGREGPRARGRRPPARVPGTGTGRLAPGPGLAFKFPRGQCRPLAFCRTSESAIFSNANEPLRSYEPRPVLNSRFKLLHISYLTWHVALMRRPQKSVFTIRSKGARIEVSSFVGGRSGWHVHSPLYPLGPAGSGQRRLARRVTPPQPAHYSHSHGACGQNGR